MNQAGIFAPDINFSPAASIFPTAAGGTSAAAASAMSATTNVTVQDANGSAAPATVTGTGPLPNSKSTVWYWLGFLLVLVLLVWVARKAGSDEDFRGGNLKASFYNFMAITLTSIVGITGLKVIATKYHVPGASEVILAA